MTINTTHSWVTQARAQDPAKVDAMRTRLVSVDWTVAGRNFLEDAGGSEDYAIWLVLADRRLTRAVGLGMFDIEDWNWADAFEGGMSPAEAAREALESSDMFGGLFE